MDHLVPCLLCILVVIFLAAPVNAVNFDGSCIADANCTENNTICTSNKCACLSSTFRNTTACVPKIAFNASCNIAYTMYTANQCSVSNMVCRLDGTYRCLCDIAYYETGGNCQERKKPGAACASGQCVANALCTNTTCVCNLGYTPANNSTACSGVTMVTVNILPFVLGVVAQLYFPSQF